LWRSEKVEVFIGNFFPQKLKRNKLKKKLKKFNKRKKENFPEFKTKEHDYRD
jgi:hypothetical protein